MTRWTDPLSKKHQTRRADRTGNKYNAVKVKDSKGSFDSKGEREMHGMLELMEKGGLVSNIRHHPPAIELIGTLKYKPDWIVFEHERKRDIAIDFKGVMTERFQAICQVWPDTGPMPLQVWKKQGNRFFMHKEIKGK